MRIGAILTSQAEDRYARAASGFPSINCLAGDLACHFLSAGYPRV